MKEIPLTQGKVALVDDEDFERLNRYKWFAHKHRNTYYAHRNIRVNGKRTGMRMARDVLSLEQGDKRIADHKDRNGLNNQKTNLRATTHGVNAYNRKLFRNNTTGYRGVTLERSGRYKARIEKNKQRISLGQYSTAVQAAIAYDNAAIKHYGKDAFLNLSPGKGVLPCV